MTTFDFVLLAFHVQGALMWVGGLFATIAFLDAYAAEPDAAARGRLAKHVRTAAIVPDIGFTIALLFGAHWLVKFKLYEAHFMHPKLALVACLLGIHIYLKKKVGQIKRTSSLDAPPPGPLKPVISLLALGILIFVLTKLPA